MLKMLNLKILKILLCFCFVSQIVFAANSNLALPRFASIKSSEANIRTGPSTRYPILWVYVNVGEPVEIIAEFEQWRKIRDRLGDVGWIHKSMLSGVRNAIVKTDKKRKFQDLRLAPHAASNVIAKIEANSVGSVKKCKKNWCQLSFIHEGDRVEGWLLREKIWGIYAKEEI